MASLISIVLASAFVAVMGFAVQRGATCCVAAVDEIVNHRRGDRLRAVLLAAAWVACVLWSTHATNLAARPPSGYAATWSIVLGAAMLGSGAYVNGACLFGTVARLGSLQWAYAFTLVGFFAASWLATSLPSPRAFHQASEAAVGNGSLALWLPLVAYSFWRWLRGGLRWYAPDSTKQRAEHDQHLASAGLWRQLWMPGAATSVIGITFAAVFLLVGGRWAYTDVLSDWAMQGRVALKSDGWRSLLLIALLTGTVLGGTTTINPRSQWPTPQQVGKCFTGGFLMGAGAVLIPGGNDGLILMGLPLLWPHAWLAVVTMFITIAIPMLLRRKLARP